MIFYSEEKRGRKSIYKKVITDENGREVSSREVEIPLFPVEKDGKTWFLLYDDEMNIISDPTLYLNFNMANKSVKTRRASAAALRLLYVFLSLSNCDVHNIGQEQLNDLIRFLQGLNSNPEQYKTETIRSNQTVNNYLGVYREFFRAKSIWCPSIFEGRTVRESVSFDTDSEAVIARTRYTNNLRTSDPHPNSVPKYISPDEFERLYKAASNNDDKQAMCIMRLMYCYGLRLGEVLGLTIEDIKETYQDDRVVPSVILRNRLSDKEFQFAKNKMHVQKMEQYHSTDYINTSVKIIIDYGLCELLYDYVNEAHSIALEQHPKQYEKASADVVSFQDAPEDNHYIFLSNIGTPLSAQTWGKKLKNYFNECGIIVDYNFRENNLSHRFRHGFAMLHAHYRQNPVGSLELQKMMRHRSISSTLVYYNLTEEDEQELREEFVNELFELIPSLRRGDEYFEREH